MNQGIVFVTLVVVLAAALTPLIRRDTRAAARRHERALGGWFIALGADTAEATRSPFIPYGTAYLLPKPPRFVDLACEPLRLPPRDDFARYRAEERIALSVRYPKPTHIVVDPA